LAELMGASMVATVGDRVSRTGSTIVVPVPTTPGRLKERGYNQAHLLAERLASLLQLPLRPVLSRALAPRSQTTLTPTQRRENVRGAFGPCAQGFGDLDGAHVLLVDDVLTTGATAAEAAVTLSRAGAATITIVAFARALPSRSRKAA
jgi:ComF family protein